MAFHIVLHGNATAQDFWDVVFYLQRSRTAWGMLRALAEAPARIEIKVKGDYRGFGMSGSRFRQPAWGRPHGELYWWVYDWTDLGGGRYLNPAMTLMHEMGHAHQYYIQNRIHWWSNWLAVENDNVRTCEAPIAIELGLPYRLDYSASLPMNNAQTYINWGKGPERAGV